MREVRGAAFCGYCGEDVPIVIKVAQLNTTPGSIKVFLEGFGSGNVTPSVTFVHECRGEKP